MNISIFVPHEGCPNQCSFCNQNAISGQYGRPSHDDIKKAAETAVNTLGDRAKEAEIAFFGGSFTAIDRDYMTGLLQTAAEYIYNFKGIRISTRPDHIDGEILSLLRRYSVTSIELGAQSLDDEVLNKNRRGHTAADVRSASGLIKEHGFSLGLQMMTGLWGDTPEKSVYTAEEIIKLNPETVRIYPAVTLKNTHLHNLYDSGKYLPMSLDETVELCAELVEMFEQFGIRIIRLGLQAGDGVEKDYIAGPYHPAFGELVYGEIFFKRALSLLKSSGKRDIIVNGGSLSKMRGHQNRNIKRFEDMGIAVRIIGDDSLKPGEIAIK